MQEKLIDLLSTATGWLTAGEIADLGGWRSNANVGVALAQMEKATGAVVRRKSPTKKQHNGTAATEWKLAEKQFAGSDTTPAAGGENNSRSGASDQPVGQSTPPAEGAINVIEAAKRDETPVAPASDTPIDWLAIVKQMERELDQHAAIMDLNTRIGFLQGELENRTMRGKTIFIDRCPFCGFDDVQIDEVRPGEFSVDCPECEAMGPVKPSEMEAISYWNDRRGA